jgi:hypothetical protein
MSIEFIHIYVVPTGLEQVEGMALATQQLRSLYFPPVIT